MFLLQSRLAHISVSGVLNPNTEDSRGAQRTQVEAAAFIQFPLYLRSPNADLIGYLPDPHSSLTLDSDWVDILICNSYFCTMPTIILHYCSS